MSLRIVHVCPACGVRNESPDLSFDDLLNITRAEALALVASRESENRIDPGRQAGQHRCPACQGVETTDELAAGERRARGERAS
jgi:predicted RNA-binding Zn-ribbon protein involved in translation (DUF1610 family)